ncbi:LacI family DNA-binding transcriptional regulator [Ruegeria sp. Ofav3-42]|uniref:LacI family DNA-binding transcriptional regulator n=1 Tax=Ruegeria sp. Ofav3-42 TaxID=2917759 RepID=UPI001EF51CB7|nr:LacI family DNA-binding transcriptional regulator [Ruegeria sp. Ofav3-42]MCG7520006.1 LacI family DNA-binding transcriptional regulator [Ruegeria sp. Ofav3-42]
MARATIKSISKETGYSVGTVSNALRGSESVREETRKEIQAAAARLGYRVNMDGLKLRTNKSYRVAVLVSVSADAEEEWEGVEFTRILAGISTALKGSQYELSVFNVADLEDAMEALKKIVHHGLADGVIFSGTLHHDPRIAFLQQNGFPFVTMGMSDGETPHAYVDIDSQAAAYDATERLLRLGHRRISLINPPSDLIYATQRQQGYAQALSAEGLPLDSSLIFNGPTTARTGRRAFEAMMQLAVRPTACICANEAMTLGVLSAAHKAGVSIGQDLVVISTDDLQLSRYFVPPPSTYYVPIEETSRLLGEFILKALDGAKPSETQKKIRANLIERQPDTPAQTTARTT